MWTIQGDELLISLVKQDWAVLEYIQHPSDDVVRIALDQSGWAIRYITNPSEELQLRARTQYDALQYSCQSIRAGSNGGCKSNYLALRYIQNPTLEILKAAVCKIRRLRVKLQIWI